MLGYRHNVASQHKGHDCFCPYCGSGLDHHASLARAPNAHLTLDLRLIWDKLIRHEGFLVPLDAFGKSACTLRVAISKIRHLTGVRIDNVHGEGYVMNPKEHHYG